jgi:hypothetical protein
MYLGKMVSIKIILVIILLDRPFFFLFQYLFSIRAENNR